MTTTIPHPLRRPALLLLAAALLVAGGCEAVLEVGTPASPGAGVPGAGGSGEGSGSGGAAGGEAGGEGGSTPDLAPGEIDPGRVTLRRLNRAEYNNTVRDLLGDTSRPADDFPDDDFGYGFNNIADVLSTSPLHVELYAATAEALVEQALDAGTASVTQRFEAEAVGGSAGGAQGDAWNLYSDGVIETVVELPAAGDYRIRARAWGQQAGSDPARMAVLRGGVQAHVFDVANTADAPGVFEHTMSIDGGGHSIGVAFVNDFYDAAAGADRNLVVDWFEVEGPLGATNPDNPARDAILVCEPASDSATDEAACAREIVASFGRRAWRRPLTTEEIDGLVGFVDLARAEGDDFEAGIGLALQAMLVSPNFLYRVEVDPDPAQAEIHPLSDHELASRLSYFLWSSMPDDELFGLADEGRLQDEAVLRAQVARMLDDPKAQALVDNFATQWLHIDRVRTASPDYAIFPGFEPGLAEAMRTETRLFVTELLEQNRTIPTLLTADFTYLNGPLAQHYEIPGISGEDFQRVQLEGEARRGILGHAGLLTSTSFPKRTSPVRRGAWVLSNLLCSEPPPPPPGVENLPDDRDGEGGGEVSGTLRERMEQHMADPTCASCHAAMDPIGFGMENYDGVGAWRDLDNGAPVDASGKLPDGTEFNGASELAGILAEDARVTRCVAEKVLTYALGRGTKWWDEPQIEALLTATEADGHRFRDVITEVVLSSAFRNRRGGELP